MPVDRAVIAVALAAVLTVTLKVRFPIPGPAMLVAALMRPIMPNRKNAALCVGEGRIRENEAAGAGHWLVLFDGLELDFCD